MKIDIKDFSLSVDSDEEAYQDCMRFEDVIYVALSNAKKQLISDISAKVKRDFLSDPRVQDIMIEWKENMIKNLKEKELV